MGSFPDARFEVLTDVLVIDFELDGVAVACFVTGVERVAGVALFLIKVALDGVVRLAALDVDTGVRRSATLNAEGFDVDEE